MVKENGKLNWRGYSTKDRRSVIEKIKKSVNKRNGYILDYNMYSDLALSLSIEIAEGYIHDLHKELQNIIESLYLT